MSTFALRQNTSDKSPLLSNSPNTGLLLQRKCACGGSASLTSECGECNKKRLQKKLSIGASNDPLEQEADRVADQVLAVPAHSAVSGTLSRIQHFTGQATGDEGTAPPNVDRVLAGSGRPLEPALQQDMGQRFGHDFSQVRVHTGAAAEQSAAEVNAHAYTVGHNIVFGAGGFVPGSYEGLKLIAHELTHVVQQTGIDEIRNVQNGLSGITQAARRTPVVQTIRPARLFRVVNYIEEVTGAEAAQYLSRFDRAVEQAAQVISAATGPEAGDLRGALERLRTLRGEGLITCWHTSGGLHYASYHSASRQIRLHVDFAAATWPSTIVHEAIHALHAQRYPRLSQFYAEVLAAGGTRDEQLGVLLLKWKAWTEYWAYRRVVEYDNLRQTDPSFRRDAHQAAMDERDVHDSIARVREATGREFNPSDWNPPQRYRAETRRR